MKSTFIAEEHCISEQTVLPGLPELFVDERKGDFLILNPLGPWWFIGSKLHVDFLKLCDGKRTLRDILELLPRDGQEVTIGALIRLAGSLSRIHFFTPAENQPVHRCGVVHFYVTKRCNLECPFCFYDSAPSKSQAQKQDLTAKEWLKLVEEIAAINPNAAISISGGEPLLRTDIIEIIKGTSQYSLEIRLITNGTLFSEGLAKHLAKIPKFTVQVSIDSLVPEENARTRGLGSLEKAITAVQWMIDAGINVGITSTVTQINKHSTWRMKQFCEQHHINFGTSFFFSSGDRSHSNAGWLELKPGEIMESSVYNSDYFKGKESEHCALTPGIRRNHCGIGCGQLSIHPEGSVSPCRLLLDPQFYLGNIRETGLHRILELGCEKYDFVGVDKTACGCATCPVRYLCVGGCKALSFSTYGVLDELPPNCSLLKKIYIESLWAGILGPAPDALDNLLSGNSEPIIHETGLHRPAEGIANQTWK
jgi:radical SAM protein with 4Fe4S-binding SPASM domain